MKKEELHRLFQLNVQKDAPELIVYSKQVNERLNYTCNFIFKHVLNCNYTLTESTNEFKKAKAIKLNYSDISIPDIFCIIPHPLIFEKGIKNEYIPESKAQNNQIYFHSNKVNCNLGYDIFSSVFYFIARYQEWQPYEKDIHGRFEASNSIQFKNKQHLKPLVNNWIEELKNELLQFYPQLKFPKKKFQYISTIDVDNLYAYQNKGMPRTLAGIAKDCLTFNFKNLSRRLKVLEHKLPDPFDVYDELNLLSKKTGIPLFYFILQSNNSKFDRTIDPDGEAFKPLFEKLKKSEIPFGLHPSYFSSTNKKLMKHEFVLIRKKSERQINLSRQHYLRFDVRKTPFQLIDNGVIADFTMGFASTAGYRAGTFTPFYFYDLEKDKPGNLLFIPFVVMDGVYFVYTKQDPIQAEVQIVEMASEVKRLNGFFVSVFHERTFDKILQPGFSNLYEKLQEVLR